MTDYVTYAELNMEPDLRGFTQLADQYGVEPDGSDLLTCFEDNPHFDELLNLLNLEREALPVINVPYYRKEYLQCFEGDVTDDEPVHWYGLFEDDPDVHKHIFHKAKSAIVFDDHGSGDDAANLWKGWLGGENAMHGDFHCMFFAKDAKNHFKYDEYPYAQDVVEHKLRFAKEKPDAVRVIFGFG
ncbi:hypothetical protein [Vibrio crassostreae]|uniref:hypothetical protein n=1 Tax=Vibrio crassostreae TaxID=246167 RepID=UPI001B316507|nr:hypothetical protein [Vibrio crassostreae]